MVALIGEEQIIDRKEWPKILMDTFRTRVFFGEIVFLAHQSQYFTQMMPLCMFIFGLVLSLLSNRMLLQHYAHGHLAEDSDQERWNIRKPETGGVSFYLCFFVAILFLYLSSYQRADSRLAGLLLAGTLAFGIGLWDDCKHISPLIKFSGQLLCAHILYVFGFHIAFIGLWWADYLFTVVWVLGIMNSINMLDNMDSISSIASLAVLMACALVVGMSGGSDVTLLLIGLAVAGALTGFLVYNWYPSKMYMGDSGSQFLGILLSALAIEFLWPYRDASGGFEIRQFVFPLLAFMIPIIDTTTVTFRRLATGQSPFVGGRDHTTHQVALYTGNDRMVAFLMGGISLVNLVVIILLMQYVGQWEFIYTVLIFIYFFLLLAFFQWFYSANKKRKNG